jgi:hypothetical protein
MGAVACGQPDFQAPDVTTSDDLAVASAAAQLRDGTCATTLAEGLQLASNMSVLTTALEPLAANQLLVCAYGIPTELPTHPVDVRLMQTKVVTDRTAVETMRQALNGAPTVPACGNGCNGVEESEQLLFFGDGTSIVTIHVHVGVPSYATNGERTLWVSDTYYPQLENLVPGFAWCRPYPACRGPYVAFGAFPPPTQTS